MERQRWANAQFSRPECLDTVDIPREVSEEVLEEKVLKIFDKRCCRISPNHIESCHRISKKKRYSYSQVSSTKRLPTSLAGQKKEEKKQKMKTEDFDLPGRNILFINRILCPYYKVVWS